MPDGQIHYEYWSKLKTPARIIALVTFNIILRVTNLSLIICSIFFFGQILAYELLGRYLDPDLDQPSWTAAEGRMIKDFGVFALPLLAYWSVYAYFIFALAYITKTTNGSLGGHRTFWSHSIPLGTIIRFVFAFWWTPFVITYFNGEYLYYSITLLLGMFVGLVNSDSIHIYLDEREKRGKHG